MARSTLIKRHRAATALNAFPLDLAKRTFNNVLNLRHLVRHMVWSERRSSVSGTILGGIIHLWEPASKIVVYLFLIKIVFQRPAQNGVDSLAVLLLGVVHYMFLSKAISSASTSISSKRSLLLQVPLEPVVLLCAQYLNSLISFAISLVVLAAFFLTMHSEYLSLTWLLYPIFLLMLLSVSWAGALVVSVSNVFMRDVGFLIRPILQLMMYVSPVIYLAVSVPEKYHSLYFMNPLAGLFGSMQAIVLNVEYPPTWAIAWSITFVFVLNYAAVIIYENLKSKITKNI